MILYRRGIRKTDAAGNWALRSSLRSPRRRLRRHLFHQAERMPIQPAAAPPPCRREGCRVRSLNPYRERTARQIYKTNSWALEGRRTSPARVLVLARLGDYPVLEVVRVSFSRGAGERVSGVLVTFSPCATFCSAKVAPSMRTIWRFVLRDGFVVAAAGTDPPWPPLFNGGKDRGARFARGGGSPPSELSYSSSIPARLFLYLSTICCWTLGGTGS